MIYQKALEIQGLFVFKAPHNFTIHPDHGPRDAYLIKSPGESCSLIVTDFEI